MLRKFFCPELAMCSRFRTRISQCINHLLLPGRPKWRRRRRFQKCLARASKTKARNSCPTQQVEAGLVSQKFPLGSSWTVAQQAPQKDAQAFQDIKTCQMLCVLAGSDRKIIAGKATRSGPRDEKEQQRDSCFATICSGSCRTVADLMRNWRTYGAEDLRGSFSG